MDDDFEYLEKIAEQNDVHVNPQSRSVRGRKRSRWATTWALTPIKKQGNKRLARTNKIPITLSGASSCSESPPESEAVKFGHAVYQRRRQLNLSQAELANRVGIHGPMISHIENGTGQLQHMQLLAKFFHISLQ